jgi:hypothetical protein
MPCRTYETPEEIQRQDQIARERELAPLRTEIHVLQEELAERDAMLCGVLSSIYYLDGYIQTNMILKDYFSNSVREWFNETESGVTWERLQSWWADHKAQDEARKQAEAADREQKRAAVLAKLTPAERELLGV